MGRRRTVRAFTLLLLGVFPAAAADNALVFSRTLGGSGGDAVSAMAVDPAGNLIVAGGTTSFDFPVTNGSVNPGTVFAMSLDSGRTWKPLGNLPTGLVLTIATDAAGVLYAGSTAGVFRSVDRGKTWTGAAPIPGLACGNAISFCGVTTIATHPTRAGVLYVGFGSQFVPRMESDGHIFKSVDGGATWTDSSNGIPRVFSFDYIVIDPFHPDTLYASSGINFRSFDGGANWSTYDLPHENAGGIGGTGDRVAFDPFTSGTIYQGSYDGIFVSTDSGATWTHSSLRVPVSGVAADPLTRSVVYAVDINQSVYRSSDSGATFTRVYQDNSGNRLLVVDPSRAGVVVTSGVRSEDGGKTWSRLSLGRTVQRLLFDPKNPGVLFAATEGSSDAFVAKLDPSGEKILFATYLGGMGSEGITGVATDADGNIYVAGLSTSTDFPATPRPPSTALPSESDNVFVAKLDPSGALLYVVPVATRLFNNVSSAIAVGPDRRPVLIGSKNVRSGQDADCVVMKLSADGSQVEFARTFGGTSYDFCTAVAVDRSNNIAVTGYTASRDFPVTGGALQPSLKPGQHAFLTKLDSSGNTLFSTYLGGADADTGAAVAFDGDGNVVVGGTTSSKDFVTTPGAYQRSMRANCPYPSSAVATGIIGTIISYQMDDGFVTKLDSSGALLFSTYLGGDCFDQVKGISLDVWGNVWVVGTTNSNQFPMQFPFESGPVYAQYKAFATRLAADGSAIYFSSYHAAVNPVIAATPGGDAYIGGSSRPYGPAFSLGLPAPPVASPPFPGFLGKIGPPPTSSMAIVSAGNAFTLRNGPISPGELTLIDVVGMADVDSIDLGFRPTAPLPRQLGRAQVFFDDEPAAIISVTQGRILCVAPYSLAGKSSTKITVAAQDDRSPAYRVDVFTSDPGARSLDGSGQGRALALNQDGTVNSPENPATRGSTVTFFVTGALPAGNCPYGGVAPSDVAPDALGFAPIPGMVCGLQALTFKVNANAPPNPDTQFPINGFLTSQTLTYAVK